MTDEVPARTLPHQPARAGRRPGRNPTDSPTMGEMIAARFSRRAMLKGSLATTAIAATVGPIAMVTAERAAAGPRPARASTSPR